MNRIVFVTGATSGIGKACAEKFAADGDKIIINGRREDRLQELKNRLEEKQRETRKLMEKRREEWQPR